MQLAGRQQWRFTGLPAIGADLALVCGVALVLRLILFFCFQPWLASTVEQSILIGDAPDYDRLAQCLAFQASFCGETFRTPGYPLFVAFSYALFGVKAWAVLLLQVFVDIGAVFLLARIGTLVFSRRVGLIAAALYAIDPQAIHATQVLLSETVFVFLVIAGLYACLRARAGGRAGGFVAAGVCIALAALVRPVAQYHLLIVAVCVLLWQGRPTLASARNAAVLLLSFAVVAGPWMARNAALYGAPKLSSIQGENLLFWQVTYARVAQTGQDPKAVEQVFQAEVDKRGYRKGGNPFQNEAIAQKVALGYIASNSAFYAQRLASGILHTFVNLNTASMAEHLGFRPTLLPPSAMFASGSQAQLVATFLASKSVPEILIGAVTALLLGGAFLCALGGVGLLLARRQYALLGLCAASIGYFALSGGVIGLARFRQPAEPYYFLLAALFIAWLLERRAAKAGRASAPA